MRMHIIVAVVIIVGLFCFSLFYVPSSNGPVNLDTVEEHEFVSEDQANAIAVDNGDGTTSLITVYNVISTEQRGDNVWVETDDGEYILYNRTVIEVLEILNR